MWEYGVKNDKLAMIYEGNKTNEVAVNTPVGQTTRMTVNRIVTQGGPLGPRLCSTQVDSLGKECLNTGENVYMYRGEVPIPPLAMVDDVLCISKCGMEAVEMICSRKLRK